MEACRLRVKDVDLERGQVLIRDGKGAKDRVALLPEPCVGAMRTQLDSRPDQSTRPVARDCDGGGWGSAAGRVGGHA